MSTKIVTLLENTSRDHELIAAHGLSFYIKTGNRKILFDLGPDESFLHNARALRIAVEDVDYVILSHGHRDHTGGLGALLRANTKARIYIHRNALDNLESISSGRHYIGLDENLKDNERLAVIDGDYEIEPGLRILQTRGNRFMSSANNTLLRNGERDDFSHEINLLIDNRILMVGCGHRGIVNIMDTVRQTVIPEAVIGGFHLMTPRTGKAIERETVEAIGKELSHYEKTHFYTCHCTGKEAIDILTPLIGKSELSTVETGVILHL